MKQTNPSRFRRLLSEESGGEVIEYALVLGLVIVVAIVAVAAVGTKAVARWTSVDTSFTP